MAVASDRVAAGKRETTLKKPKKKEISQTKHKKVTAAPEPLSPAIGFLDLAIETRVKVYKLCFTGAVLFVHDHGIDLKSSRARGELARASMEIYSESMPILYSLTTLKYIPRLVLRIGKPVTLIRQNLTGYTALRVLRIDVGGLELDMTLDDRWTPPRIRRFIRREAKLVLGISEAIEGRRPGLDPVYRVQKGPIKLDDLNNLALSKKRVYKIEVAANIEFQFNIGTVSMSIVVDWVGKTIISKELRARTKQDVSEGLEVEIDEGIDEGDDGESDDVIAEESDESGEEASNEDIDEGAEHLSGESSPLGFW